MTNLFDEHGQPTQNYQDIVRHARPALVAIVNDAFARLKEHDAPAPDYRLMVDLLANAMAAAAWEQYSGYTIDLVIDDSYFAGIVNTQEDVSNEDES